MSSSSLNKHLRAPELNNDFSCVCGFPDELLQYSLCSYSKWRGRLLCRNAVLTEVDCVGMLCSVLCAGPHGPSLAEKMRLN